MLLLITTSFFPPDFFLGGNRFSLIINRQPTSSKTLLFNQELNQRVQSYIQHLYGFILSKSWQELKASECFEKIQQIHDDNLEKIWKRIHETLKTKGVEGLALDPRIFSSTTLLKKIPSSESTAYKIRAWLEKNPEVLAHVRKLDLSHLQLTMVPLELGACTQLQVLDLSRNSLRGLPRFVSTLPSLEVLSLKYNYFTAVPLLPRGVKALDLSWNRLLLFRDAERTFGALKKVNLKTLLLNENDVENLFERKIPKWIKKIPDLGIDRRLFPHSGLEAFRGFFRCCL